MLAILAPAEDSFSDCPTLFYTLSLGHIEILFSKEAIDWALISCHLPEMLQVVQSIRAGRLSPSTILRKLGTASRKNKLYFAFREQGRVIRTLFLLEHIGDDELRSVIQAAQNKCEGFNQFT